MTLGRDLRTGLVMPKEVVWNRNIKYWEDFLRNTVPYIVKRGSYTDHLSKNYGGLVLPRRIIKTGSYGPDTSEKPETENRKSRRIPLPVRVAGIVGEAGLTLAVLAACAQPVAAPSTNPSSGTPSTQTPSSTLVTPAPVDNLPVLKYEIWPNDPMEDDLITVTAYTEDDHGVQWVKMRNGTDKDLTKVSSEKNDVEKAKWETSLSFSAGDHPVTIDAYDGKNKTSETSTIRVVPNPVSQYLRDNRQEGLIPGFKALGKGSKVMSEYAKAVIDFQIKHPEISIVGIADDGKVDNNENDLIKVLFELPSSAYADARLKPTMEGIFKDGIVSSEEVKQLQAYTSLKLVSDKSLETMFSLGIDDNAINYILFVSSLPDKDFVKYSLETALCIKDKQLTELEKSFLKEPDTYKQQLFDYYLTEINKVNPGIAMEIPKVPDFKTIGIKQVEALEDIENLAIKPEYKVAFDSMLNEGIPNKRKYCTPLEELTWIAYDKEFDDFNPLRNYSLESLTNEAWKNTTESNNFNSERWSYEKAKDRVNSPTLMNWFINHYLTFDMKRDNVHPQGPHVTYEVRRGVCRHAAYISTDFLSHNGYDAKNITVLYAPNTGHGVSSVRQDDKIWVVVDFRGDKRPIEGPFKTYNDAIQYIADSYKWKSIYQTFVENNLELMGRNNDFE